MQDIENKLSELVGRVLANTPFRVVDQEIKRTSNRRLIRLFVDSNAGITIDECTEINRHLNDLIESEDAFDFDYVLEVSSPGVDRPIKDEWQFRKNIGRRMEVTYRAEPEADPCVVAGKLERIEDGCVILSRPGKKNREVTEERIGFDRVVQAKIKLPW